MTWFKVDDQMWSHRKFITTPSLAIGVWARVGSYCACHLTDGVIDLDTVHAICPESRAVVDRAVAELVRRGLWEVTADPSTRVYHDWADHQPTRDEVLARRQVERDKKARQRRDKGGRFAVVQGGQSP